MPAVDILNPNLNSASSSGGLAGTWNASTNTPALANTDTGKVGVMYQVSTGGAVDFGAGNITFEAKDIVVNNGTVWDKIDATDAVISVNGNNGVVVLDKTDIGLTNVDNTSDANKPVSTAQQTALNNKVDVDGAKVLSEVNFTSAKDSKLTGIEANADVTDSVNVDNAGAVMNTDTSTSSMSFVIDEDDMNSDSATKVPTQQSVKAYVDANTGGGGGSNILKGTVTIDIGNIGVNGANRIETITFTGAQVGGVVMISPTGSMGPKVFIGYAYVSAVDEIKIVFYSNDDTSYNPSSQDFHIAVVN